MSSVSCKCRYYLSVVASDQFVLPAGEEMTLAVAHTVHSDFPHIKFELLFHDGSLYVKQRVHDLNLSSWYLYLFQVFHRTSLE